MRARFEANASLMLTGLVLIVLAGAVVAIADDVMSQPQLRADVSTVTRTLNWRADIVAGPITANSGIGQRFRATERGLSEVAIRLATYGRENHVPLVFSLREDTAGRGPLRTVSAQPETIADNAYHAFKFAPIPDSSGKTYLLTLESPQGTSGDAFTAWLGDCDCYEEGEALLNGEEVPRRDLTLRVGYHEEVSSALDELINRLSQYKPWFFKGGFLASLGLVLLGLTLFAVGSFTFSVLDPRPDPRWSWVPLASLVYAAVMAWFVQQ